MIVADIFRGIIVLGMLVSFIAADVRLIYLLLGVEMIFSSLFEPARSAILPNIAPSNVYPTRDGLGILVAANQDSVFAPGPLRWPWERRLEGRSLR